MIHNILKALKSVYTWLPLILLAGSLQACSQEAQTFKEKLDQLYSHEVALIKPEALHERLQKEDTVILLDTREKAEHNVSHLKNAVWVGYKDFQESKVEDIPRTATVVTYCTVGYRSEKIGAYLEENGFKNVYNLYGSIIGWVNAGYPVYNNKGEKTDQVHTYSKEWGKWLKQGEAVYE